MTAKNVQGVELARLPVPAASKAAPWSRSFKATRRHVVSGVAPQARGISGVLGENPVKTLLAILAVIFVAGLFVGDGAAGGVA